MATPKKADERATIRVRAKKPIWYADQVMHKPGEKTEVFLLYPRRIGGDGERAGQVLTADEQFNPKTMERLGAGPSRNPVELEKVYTSAISVINGEDQEPEMVGVGEGSGEDVI